jgi:hypothetical protein
MAIEYTLYVDTDASPLHLHGIVCACVHDESDAASAASASSLGFSGAGLQGVVSAPDTVTRQFVREDFSFDARARIGLRLDKFEMEKAQISLVRCISELARTNDDDMILLFNGELVVLRRSAGDLVLREGFGLWTPERLALFATPYRLGSV